MQPNAEYMGLRTPRRASNMSRPKKAKACQRCRSRKQRCDNQVPTCRNCASANIECIPASHEPMGMYSVSYVRSLESQLSNFQDHPGEPISNQIVNQPHSDSPSRQILEQPINHNVLNHGGLAPQDAPEQLGMTYLAPLYTPNNMLYDLDLLQQEENLFSISHIPPVSHRDTTTSPVAASDTTVPVQSLSQATAPTVAEVSINEGACFFQTYFETVHPRYPFLDVEECSRAYQDWKTGDIFISSGSAWSSYLVKMIFANGSILRQARLDYTTRRQHRDLMLQAQADQSIMTDSTHKPLIRLQAMLLYAIHALHGESTSRLVHIIGVVMRFAVLHRFNRLVNDGTDETIMSIKAWWCIYSLDKVVAITLQLPPYPPEEWITTPSYESRFEPQFEMPWASDVPGSTERAIYNFDLSYYAHMCRIRRIHSRILTATQDLAPGTETKFIEEMRAEIDQWSQRDKMYAYGRPNTEGHASPLGLTHVADITRVFLYSSVKADINSPLTDELLQACCDTCTGFRALQKKRQIPKHWIDMLFQFQTGVTIIYQLWRRGTPISKAADRAIRDCTSSLAIFADRSQNTDIYRDCLDVLASSITRSLPPGKIDDESRQELAALVQQIVESGIAPHVAAKLSEMTANFESG
ncbi:hypothetical protein PV10_07016 [Exophiala mesophila]|uniref:Zn(2)-C6 fungal-type domain-containing protein n=1 Tax=Exophiala mesophila TaxID=212818 RepID=A0A0D1WKX1_EXOME|nr:uncharacterized protein PV10_07016 [Exophiala mesophila]KIV89630.1 hypothetical protein PV10_07016 [Exophiala mesophila]